jgi:hypothetical protein
MSHKICISDILQYGANINKYNKNNWWLSPLSCHNKFTPDTSQHEG